MSDEIIAIELPDIIGGIKRVVFSIFQLWDVCLFMGLHHLTHLLAIVGPILYNDVVQGVLEVVGIIS